MNRIFFYVKIQDAPRPYLFSFASLDLREFYKENDIFEFNIVLLNEFIHNFPFILYAIIQMGELGLTSKQIRFDVSTVEMIDTDTEEAFTVFENSMINSINPKFIKTFDFKSQQLLQQSQLYQKENNVLSIKFITPFRIRQNGQLKDNLTFKDIFNACLRRVSLLIFYYDNINTPIIDYKQIKKNLENVVIIENKTNWLDWQRYSTRQEEYMQFGGIIGEIKFNLKDFDISQYINILKFCEIVNIGKNYTFGNGRIKWE